MKSDCGVEHPHPEEFKKIDGNQNSSSGVLSYMQATKSVKAKLRLHGTSSPGQQGSDKTIRRYSLPYSGNNATVTSDFPETTRVSNLGGKAGKRPRKL
ncbi:hypothetical protein Bca4012_049051 [Brassica carinata]|uniref:DUF4005 domain-containing protein n=1 Tax=Brassica carinata TaxID=52824 RepID=A0A8X7R2W2_BRACI|nr:hypothetical protein Bca52824_051862 [Brassica carinata]